MNIDQGEDRDLYGSIGPVTQPYHMIDRIIDDAVECGVLFLDEPSKQTTYDVTHIPDAEVILPRPKVQPGFWAQGTIKGFKRGVTGKSRKSCAGGGFRKAKGGN